MGTVRIGRLWEQIKGLTSSTERGVLVYANVGTQALNLDGDGVLIGRLENVEEFGGSVRGHVELCTDIPGQTANEHSPTLTVENQKGFQ